MATDWRRRRLLQGAVGAALAPVWLSEGYAIGIDGGSVLTCWADSPDKPRKFSAGLSASSRRALRIPARGHGVLWHSHSAKTAFVVARRPGSFLIRWNVSTGRVLAQHELDDESRFEGHIALSQDGKRLFATETDLITAQGRIAVFDANSLQRLATWPTHGIGPHDLQLLGNGQLAVCNGGILTLPETGRVKRNLDTMDPSLVMLNPDSGEMLKQYRLPDAFMSVRHIAQAQDGTVAVALQNQGTTPRPLLAMLRGERLQYVDADSELLKTCGSYAGGVCAMDDLFAVSCTTAGVTAMWNVEGQPLFHVPTRQVCALAATSSAWVATGGEGGQWLIGRDGRVQAIEASALAWDNHAVAA